MTALFIQIAVKEHLEVVKIAKTSEGTLGTKLLRKESFAMANVKSFTFRTCSSSNAWLYMEASRPNICQALGFVPLLKSGRARVDIDIWQIFFLILHG